LHFLSRILYDDFSSRRNGGANLSKILLLIAASFLVLPLVACNYTSPPEPSEGGCLEQGAIVSSSSFCLHWTSTHLTPDLRDRFDLEIMDASENVLVSVVDIVPQLSFARHGQTIFVELTNGPSNFSGTTSEISLHASCGATYRWHVRQRVNGQTSPWSPDWNFRLAIPPTTAPALLAPAEGARVNSGALTFSPIAGVETNLYEFEVYQDSMGAYPASYFAATIRPFLTLGSESPILSALLLLPDHVYFWRVRAGYAPVCFGPWSAIRSFIWTGQSMGGSMAAPPPICPLDDCDATAVPTRTPTRTPMTIGIGTIPTSAVLTPLWPTRTNTLTHTSPPPTPTFTPFPPADTFTPVPLDCSVFTEWFKCESNSCYWWSTGYCKPIPEPPACSTYKTQATCVTDRCVWESKDGSCKDK
jgi:hypothetical protein